MRFSFLLLVMLAGVAGVQCAPAPPVPNPIVWPQPFEMSWSTGVESGSLFIDPSFAITCPASGGCGTVVESAIKRYTDLIFFAGPPTATRDVALDAAADRLRRFTDDQARRARKEAARARRVARMAAEDGFQQLFPEGQEFETGASDEDVDSNYDRDYNSHYNSNYKEADWEQWEQQKKQRQQQQRQPGRPLSMGTLVAAHVSVGTSTAPLALGMDESYTLNMTGPDPEQQTAYLHANTQWGAIRGLETLAQVIEWDTEVTAKTLYFVPAEGLRIVDKPRYQWRGILLDTSRHYHEVSSILMTIDTMSYNKLNTLHWHLVDSTSWPLVSAKYPLFSEKGAYNARSVYTAKDVATIVQHAYDRGIRVLPEFDMPAHSTAWSYGYPDLVWSCDDGQPLLDPTGRLYPVLDGLLKEFSPVFTDKFVHFGGDEVLNYKCWNASSVVLAFAKEKGFTNLAQVQNYFETQVQNVATNNDLTVIVWEDVFNAGFDLLPETVVNVWRTTNKTLEVVNAGYRVVHSYGWYLDQQTPAGEVHYLWQDTWMNFYLNEPTGPVVLPPEKEALILGGEASMWSEQVESANVISRMWPRSLGTAERLWSPRSINNVTVAAPRLAHHRCNILRRGIPAGPIRPGSTYIDCVLQEDSIFTAYHEGGNIH